MGPDQFESMYLGQAPWDIPGPQPAFVALEEAGAIRGSVLDAGCGTGENALYLASRSVAFPIALAGLPTIFIGLLGRNPFPTGSIALAIFAWTALAIGMVALRPVSLVLPTRRLGRMVMQPPARRWDRRFWWWCGACRARC